jgi:hypothetical protein
MRPSEGALNLRNAYFANGKEYQQFVEEYQIEREANKIENFIFNEK